MTKRTRDGGDSGQGGTLPLAVTLSVTPRAMAVAPPQPPSKLCA